MPVPTSSPPNSSAKNEGATQSELGVKRLALVGAVLSIDNLVIGFALGAYHVNLVVAALTMAAVSVVLSLLGVELAGSLGKQLGRRSELVGALALIVVGVANEWASCRAVP